jgi:hypothetical protein
MQVHVNAGGTTGTLYSSRYSARDMYLERRGTEIMSWDACCSCLKQNRNSNLTQVAFARAR